MKTRNRREHKRLRIEKSVKIPVYISPVVPFIGSPLTAHSLNMSNRGLAIRVQGEKSELSKLKVGAKLKIHFRLPPGKIQECRGVVTHQTNIDLEEMVLGIRFTKISRNITEDIGHMIEDNESCDKRILEEQNPWCFPSCSFYKLCRKPIRAPETDHRDKDLLEIALQKAA